MDATLKLTSNTLAYGDVGTTNNPAKRFCDWSIQRQYPVRNPKAEPFTIAPGVSFAVFAGTRDTAIDNTTEFTLSLSTLASDRYRFTHTAGTAPELRTDRALALNGNSVQMTVNQNQTVTAVASAGGLFAAVVAGDTLFIPGSTTGDTASPFDAINEGYWLVLDADGDTTLQLTRPSNQSFQGTTELVAITDNAQIQAYSSDGVQVGDGVAIDGAFPVSVQRTYEVVAVNPEWFEVVTSVPLPIGVSATPDTALKFYSAAKRYIRIEADQECVVRLNGDTGDSNRLSPWVAADPDNTAFMEKVGPCWQAVVVNKSTSLLNILVVSAE